MKAGTSHGGGNWLHRMHKDIHNLASYRSFSKYAGPPFIATAIFAQCNSQTFATVKQNTNGKSNL